MPTPLMIADPQPEMGNAAHHYEALLRISEALSTCSEPEELPRVLADHLYSVIDFDHLDIIVFKENSNEIEWHVWGAKPISFPDFPVEETSIWHVYRTQEALHIPDWREEHRFPSLKRMLEAQGHKFGSAI